MSLGFQLSHYVNMASLLRLFVLVALASAQDVCREPGEARCGESAGFAPAVHSASLLQAHRVVTSSSDSKKASAPDPKTGAWAPEDVEDRAGALNVALADSIAQLLQDRGGKSLGDFGAGTGEYSRYWKNKFALEVFCVDGNAAINETSGGLCSQMDLSETQPAEGLPKMDLSISLEVAEHIPKEHERSFLANLRTANRMGIIISWAHPGQDGNGHVNCQPQSYVVDAIEKLGYKLNQTATHALRSAAHHPGNRTTAANWMNFNRNLLMFDPYSTADQ